MVSALVLYGYGINCDQESTIALKLAGFDVQRMHVSEFIKKPSILEDVCFLFFPGGFSFGDELGSGRVLAQKVMHHAKRELLSYVDEGKVVLGVCNGFQVLIKMGLLPVSDFVQRATLTFNDSGYFEDRWVFLKVNERCPARCFRDFDYLMLPVRHGEGKFVAPDDVLNMIIENDLHVLQYADKNGNVTTQYPDNPNGSMESIAGICNEEGNVIGMMPHPEAYLWVTNNPLWTEYKDKVKDWKGAGRMVFERFYQHLSKRF